MEITEEQLKNMSPDEIKELQKQNCIFCHIVSGRVQSKKVYEDENVFAILDINPANPGHLLLLTKEHYAILPQIPEELISHMFMVAKALSNASLRALKTQGTNIFIANGVSAGQKAPHFMIHIIPRKENDGLTAFELKRSEISEEEILTAEIKQKFKEVSGIKKEEPLDLDRGEKVVEAEFTEEKPAEEEKEETKEEKVEEEKEEDKEAETELPPPPHEEEQQEEEEIKEEEPAEEEKKETEQAPKEKNKGIDLDSIAKVLLGR